MGTLKKKCTDRQQIPCQFSYFQDPFIFHLRDKFFLPLSSTLSFSVIGHFLHILWITVYLSPACKAISQINFNGLINSDSVFSSKLRERKIVR